MPTIYTSDNFDDGNFRAHGNYQARIENNIFICSVSGPLNVEGIIALGKTRRACLAHHKVSATIPSIVVFQNSMLMSPEALNVYAQNLKQFLEEVRSTFLVAYVIPNDVEGKAVMLPLIRKVFEKNKITWQVFENTEDAKSWIKSVS